jgi:hypothetical protein
MTQPSVQGARIIVSKIAVTVNRLFAKGYAREIALNTRS